MQNAFAIAATRGGSGKTLISVGLGAYLRELGYRIVPFKKGPDYIDAGWLTAATGVPCHNLDLFLMSPDDVVTSFVVHSHSADVTLIEGNRGLFDGLDENGTCSTAELAKLLDVPVVLIIDATKATRTIAALVLGCMKLDEQVKIAGVIINNTANPRQERIIRLAIEKECGIPVFGVIPRQLDNPFPERHLGLIPAVEHGHAIDAVKQAKNLVEQYVNVEHLLKCTYVSDIKWSRCKRCSDFEEVHHCGHITDPIKLGVVRDEIFQFYYPENLQALESLGVCLIYLTSLDETLPSNIDGLYIGGGFPETHLDILAGNKSLKMAIKERIESGLPVYAECGGLMYLAQSITVEDRRYSMVGIFPADLVMCRKPQGHGYSVGYIARENPFWPKGTWIKGHEFHYSQIIRLNGEMLFAAKLKKGHGIIEQLDGMVYKNCVAFYTHVHVIGNERWAHGFVKLAKRYRLLRVSMCESEGVNIPCSVNKAIAG